MRDNRNRKSASINGTKPGPGDRNVPKFRRMDSLPKQMLKKNHIQLSRRNFFIILQIDHLSLLMFDFQFKPQG